MILATYLPIFRVHELRIFQKNVDMLRLDRVEICVDYFFDERQSEMLRPYLPPNASLMVGNITFVRGRRIVGYVEVSGVLPFGVYAFEDESWGQFNTQGATSKSPHGVDLL